MEGEIALRLAGAIQLAIATLSLMVPVVLGWRRETDRLSPLTRQVFWIWGGYIWGTHMMAGALSLLRPHWLLDGSGLARCICSFLCLWWGMRLFLQFSVMDRGARPAGRWAELAELCMVIGFASLALTYGGVALR